MTKSAAYRPEIDGLRTLAIVPVLIYHLRIPAGSSFLLPGGFLGVDVFFVISGYLITRIILEEFRSEAGFRLGRFYERRARRILPALLLVSLATALAAPFVMLPSEIDRLALSLLAALGFVSNFYWFAELGEYGAQSGLLQPMLHTWSLAIEEQFYLAFPLVLLLVRPRGPRSALAFLALAAVFLAVAAATTQLRPALSFFAPSSRAWELFAGSALAARTVFAAPRALPGWLPAVGLAAILASMALVHLPSVHHPGLLTLPTVLGTVALIAAAHPEDRVTRLLSAPAMVAVGKLSYSLYLWHFPIFALGRLANPDLPGPADWLLWLVLTAICSMLGYRLVEKPFRFRASGRLAIVSAGAALAAVAAFAAAATQTSWLDRTERIAALYGKDEPDNELLRDRSMAVLQAVTPGEIIDSENVRKPSRHELEDLWFSPRARIRVLIIGDSHSKDLFNALYLNRQRFAGTEFARFATPSQLYAGPLAALYDTPNFAAADVIVISARYSENYATTVPPLIRSLRSRGKRVVVVGPTAEFISPGQPPVFDWYLRRFGRPADMGAIARKGYAVEDRSLRATAAHLRRIAAAGGAAFLDRRALVCRDEQRSCALVTSGGRKAMYDYGHWTLEGARDFGRRAAEAGWGETFAGAGPARSLVDSFEPEPAGR